MKKCEKNSRRYYYGALVSVFVGTAFGAVLQFFKGDVLDFAAAGETARTARASAWLFCLILCEVACYFLYDWFKGKYVVGCTGVLKRDIFESILNRDYGAFRQWSQGEYLSKYTTEIETVQARYFRMKPMFWEILFKIILVSGALFFLDWRIAIVTIGLLTTPLYVPKLIEKRLQNAQEHYLRAAEENLARVTDYLAGFEVIKNYSVERKIMERFGASNGAAVDALWKDTRLGNLSGLISTLISYLSYFTVLACAAGLVLAGEFSSGDFFVAIGMIDQLSYPLISLAGIIRQLISVKPTCDAMEEFLRAPAQNTEEAAPEHLNREIRFRDVSFSYDGGRAILDNFDLTIRKGERCLLKGPSGCGKTTAINLLLKYYPPSGGSIEIDGISLTQIGSAYGLMTVVRQEATLFRDTLRNNLTMYRQIPEERLVRVLCDLGLERLANAQALDETVSDQGSNFSGGEKKRICLARALLRDTEVLILDEPLANLDPGTVDALEDLILSVPDRTVIVVSHQFSPEKLRKFDRVVTMTAK